MPVANFTPSVSSSGTSAVYLAGTAGTIGVRVGQVDGSVAVYFSPANPAVSATFGGTMATYFDQSNPAVTAYTLDGATKRALRGNSDGAVKVYDIADGSIVVRSITASVAVHLLSTNGTIAVNVQRINETVAVYLQNTAGTLAIKIDPGYNVVNSSSTIIIPQPISGTANGISTSGNTLKAGVASRLIKVYAYSLSTTSAISQAARFTNGSGASPVEYWRVAMQAPANIASGANFGVQPPGYLFAVDSGSTLALVLDGGLVHYSLAYFLESA